MKKIIFMFLILTNLLTLASCNNKENLHIDNQKEVDEFKTLLDKQDLSPFYERMFSAMFKQDYVSYMNSYGDEEDKGIDFYRYSGTGTYGYYYSVTQEEYEDIMEKENVNPFDFISRGPGNYSLLQSAHINTFSSELVDGLEKNQTQDFNFIQNLNSLFDDNDLQVYNDLKLYDEYVNEPYLEKKFNGKVNKEALLEVVSTSWLTDTIQRICAFDGQECTEFLDGLYYDICRDLLTKNDKEISDFIKNNNIVISEGEEYLELSFDLNDEDIKEIMIDNDIFPGTFNGTLYYDKEDGSFERYLYEINTVNNTFDEEELYISSTKLKFEATGYSYHNTYEKVPYINPDPVVYTDAYEFVIDMVDNIIPPISLS